jgi:hypothetical protein
MASVDSSTLSKRYLILRGDPSAVGDIPDAENGIYLGPDYEDLADAVSGMNDLQSQDTGNNYYVVEALTSLPNPADS